MMLSRSALAHRRRLGLSLIEVLLAMAIFFMAIVAIARLVDMGTDSELNARMNAIGSRLVQAKMAEIESGFTPLDSTGGQFDNSDSDWSWTMTSTSVGTNFYNVTVTVSRDLKGQQFTISIGQMIFDPNYKGTAAIAARPDPTDSSTTTTPTTGSGGTP
jgi:Tfp pilus assembly protein PilV